MKEGNGKEYGFVLRKTDNDTYCIVPEAISGEDDALSREGIEICFQLFPDTPLTKAKELLYAMIGTIETIGSSKIPPSDTLD